ncbi:MAG: hypothetical protein AMXMBFR84_14000 [Candidatus Hydrogenedentota bacterium]
MSSPVWVRWTSRILALSLLAMVSTRQMGCPPPPENCSEFGYADVNGLSISYKSMGTGGPVVIFMSGMGDNSSVWNKVLPGVAEFTTGVVYNRGGVSCTEEGTNPRTADVIADELKGFLDTLGLQDPVIICAHSIAGIFARYFANQYPERVAGMVLVDCTHEDLDDELARIMTPQALAEEDLAYGYYFDELDHYIGAVGEYYNKNFSYRLVRDNNALTDMPFIYLGATQYVHALESPEQAALADGIKQNFDQVQANLVPSGVLIEVDSSHEVQVEKPQAVIDAVKQVFDDLTVP